MLSAIVLRARVRLGPISTNRILRDGSYRRLSATVSAADAHPIGWLSGVPTQRRWVSLSRVLFLGSSYRLHDYSCSSDPTGPDATRGGGYCPRGAIAPLAATLTRTAGCTLLGVIRFGWPSWALRLSSDPRVSCPTVAGRRFPPCPLSLVLHGQSAVSRTGLRLTKPS